MSSDALSGVHVWTWSRRRMFMRGVIHTVAGRLFVRVGAIWQAAQV